MNRAAGDQLRGAVTDQRARQHAGDHAGAAAGAQRDTEQRADGGSGNG